MTKKKVMLTIDEQVLTDTQRLLRSMGMKLSSYTEMLYRSLVDSETKPMKEVYEMMFTELVKDMNDVKGKRAKQVKRAS